MRRYSASSTRQQRQDGRQDAMAITATALSALQQLCSSSPLPITPLVSAAQAIVTAAQVSDILGVPLDSCQSIGYALICISPRL
jgi:hypothetical protein